MKISNLASLLILVLISFSTSAQEVEYEVSETKIRKLGKTRPVSELTEIDVTSSTKKHLYKLNKTAPDNFKGRGQSLVSRPDLEHQGPDAVRQIKMGSVAGPQPLVNIDGLNANFVNDPTGDVGTNHYLQAVNGTRIGIYDKAGNQLEVISANTLWAEFNKIGRGDPIILFDEMSSRWMITEFANPANVLIAISDTDDPLGSYTAYDFSTPSFPDYPKYAIWPNAIVITTNEQGPTRLHNYFIQRDSLLAGADDVTMQRIQINGLGSTEAGFYVTTPLDFNGTVLPPDSLPVVMKLNDSSWGQVSEDRLELFTFDIDWDNQANTSVNRSDLITAPFDSYPCAAVGQGFGCIPQRNGSGLDGIPEVVMNVPQYRNFGSHESVVLSFVTDATDGDNLAAVRWMELRRMDGSDWSIYQEGTYAPDDGLHRWMSSIAIDKDGNIALGYNVSSEDDFVGIRYTGRFADDPLGEMTFDEIRVIDGLNRINSGERFGDYAQMSLDPVDERTFWYTTEYAGNNGSRTRIVSFRLEKNSFDASPVAIISPVSSGDLTDMELVTVEVENKGLNDISGLEIGLLLDGEMITSYTLSDPLTEDQVFQHTFEMPVDLSAVRSYNLGLYTSFEGDEVPQNDTILTEVVKLAETDGVMGEVEDFSTCNESKTIVLTLTNNGANPMTEAVVQVSNDGTIISEQTFVGDVPFGEAADFPVVLGGLSEGVNQVETKLISVNGAPDQNAGNNTANFEVDFMEGRDEFVLTINLDDFPEETSWFFSRSTGGIFAAGGGYTDAGGTVTETFCVETDQCYRFRIFDSGNDGICCSFGNGNYQIVNAEGEVVVSSSGQFGGEEETEFCAGMPCLVTAEIEVTDASGPDANDGAILIDPSGGADPYQFSIDGGETFQEEPLFEGLSMGSYDVLVVSNGCQFEDEVIVGVSTSTEELGEALQIVVSPNPGEGYYSVEVANSNLEGYQMMMQVIDGQGKLLQEMPLQKYNGIFKGQISLVSYPTGTYYLRFMDKNIRQMERLIKI